MNKFHQESEERISSYVHNTPLQKAAKNFFYESVESKYSYNFYSLGIPIIQYPQEMIAMQELIWQTRPELIIETGIAHGGSLIWSASMLALLDYCECIENGNQPSAQKSKRKVLGIDIDIRTQNRANIEAHPMSSLIEMMEGSSIDSKIINDVKIIASNYKRIMVCLDSNHTHEHVLAELKAYAPLVTKGSYCVVFDTCIEDLPQNISRKRPWDIGNNPKTAVCEFLKNNNEFIVDNEMENKLLISVSPNGYLKRIS